MHKCVKNTRIAASVAVINMWAMIRNRNYHSRGMVVNSLMVRFLCNQCLNESIEGVWNNVIWLDIAREWRKTSSHEVVDWKYDASMSRSDGGYILPLELSTRWHAYTPKPPQIDWLFSREIVDLAATQGLEPWPESYAWVTAATTCPCPGEAGSRTPYCWWFIMRVGNDRHW